MAAGTPKARSLITRRRPGRSRLTRTILLGAAAVAAALVWLTRELALDTEELLSFLWMSFAFVGLFAALAVVVGATIALLRRVRERASREP